MSTFTDPFTAVEGKLWELAATHSGVMDLVKPGNRLDSQDTARRAQKEGHLGADLPELRLIPSGGAVIGMTSTSVRITQNFDFQLLTGSERPYKQLYPVRWQLIRAWSLTRRDQARQNLGLPYVTDLKLATFNDIQNGVQADKSDNPTWASALQFTVEMILGQHQLETQNAPA